MGMNKEIGLFFLLVMIIANCSVKNESQSEKVEILELTIDSVITNQSEVQLVGKISHNLNDDKQVYIYLSNGRLSYSEGDFYRSGDFNGTNLIYSLPDDSLKLFRYDYQDVVIELPNFEDSDSVIIKTYLRVNNDFYRLNLGYSLGMNQINFYDTIRMEY